MLSFLKDSYNFYISRGGCLQPLSIIIDNPVNDSAKVSVGGIKF